MNRKLNCVNSLTILIPLLCLWKFNWAASTAYNVGSMIPVSILISVKFN